MGEMALDQTDSTSVEAVLREGLAQGNRALLGVAPVVSHMLETTGQSLVSDAIVARLRGMLSDLARQLLIACDPPRDRERVDDGLVDRLADALASDDGLLNHLFAVAMEGQLVTRLEQQASLDPVLSPLLQELIASDQATTAELAMSTLAAQSRFLQNHRRMGYPLAELPADLFLNVLKRFRKAGLGLDTDAMKVATRELKNGYDEARGRLGLLARLVSGMGGGAIAALELEHAGLALFTTSLAARTRQSRELAVLACHPAQTARLVVSLRAGGLDGEAIARQVLLLEPTGATRTGLADISVERAAELLEEMQVSSGFDQAVL